jgi:hypothetical protein
MPKGATQVIFECSEQFRRRIDQQKLKLGKSVKQMIMEALEAYWDSKHGQGAAAVVTIGRAVDDPERAHWEEMFGEYVERCPPAKVELLQRVIEEDLKVHRRESTAGHSEERSPDNQSRRRRVRAIQVRKRVLSKAELQRRRRARRRTKEGRR